jgi:RNA polymerase sigma factor (TIGR02999 family)
LPVRPGTGIFSGVTTHPAGLDDPALDRLFGRVYDELRRLAHRVRGGRAGDTLNTTALVHEAYLKLAAAPGLHLKSREHFFALAARAMRQIVTDAARRRLAAKRGGEDAVVTLDESLHQEPLRPGQLVALDEALARLETVDPRRARVVEHRIFAGLTADQTAVLLGVSRPTVERDWRAARAWLATELEDRG